MTICKCNTDLSLHKIRLLSESLSALENYRKHIQSNPAAASIHGTLELELINQYELLCGEIRSAAFDGTQKCT